jgi:1-acyl-sn-glycerol-3-phosphate acyltransferase
MTARFAGTLLAAIARLVSGASVLWLDCKPELRARVYFANHSSHLDFVLLWAALPDRLRERTRPVAARDYWDRPGLRGWISREVFRAVLVDRPAPVPVPAQPPAEPAPAGASRGSGVIERLAEAIGTDGALILFPEGTRGTGESLAPFRSGIARLARLRPDVEFVPVWLENLNRILPKGHLLAVPLLARVVFGRPLRIEPDEPPERFLERSRDALLRLKEA